MGTAFLGALAYPLHKNNLWFLLAGAAAFFLPQVLSWVLPATNLVATLFQVALVLYFALFLQSILESSMAGKEAFPGWPEQPSLLAYAESVLGILGPYAISFLPLIALRCVYFNFGDLGRQGVGVIRLFMSGPIPNKIPQTPDWFEPASWALTAAGLIYLPMALLVWSFYGGNTVLNPFFVVRNILRAAGSYVLTIVMMAALLFAWHLAMGMATELPLGGLDSIVSFITLSYVLCVSMRMIGLHYFMNRDRLQWERR